MYNFKNTILIVVFNYSSCICNKNTIKDIYEKHFKKIIFYSDYPIIEDDEVNFIEINNGTNTHKIFNHYYKNNKSMIDDSDGLFYTMDDNIINVNILNLFDSEKIIYYKPNIVNDDMSIILNGITTDYTWFKLDNINNHFGWQWDDSWGKNAVANLINDSEFKKYNIDTFCGSFSDWFYLPKKYFTKQILDLFYLFAKYKVFLEIAIPTTILFIEPDKTQYQGFTHEMLWCDDRKKFLDKNYIYNSLNHNHNLLIHPIKFNENPTSMTWLEEFFCKETV
jgi:hypothetical protein